MATKQSERITLGAVTLTKQGSVLWAHHAALKAPTEIGVAQIERWLLRQLREQVRQKA